MGALYQLGRTWRTEHSSHSKTGSDWTATLTAKFLLVVVQVHGLMSAHSKGVSEFVNSLPHAISFLLDMLFSKRKYHVLGFSLIHHHWFASMKHIRPFCEQFLSDSSPPYVEIINFPHIFLFASFLAKSRNIFQVYNVSPSSARLERNTTVFVFHQLTLQYL